jgi:predicted enzyme related to lactoylglutathione lyase
MAAKLAVPHIDVGIVTDDREAALAFWSHYMGFPVQGEVSFPGLTVIRLQVGDAILRLCVKDEPVARKACAGGFDEETGLRYLTLTVHNLDELVAGAAARGYPVPYPPREIRPGHRVAQVQDGQGVTVELVEIAAS